MIERLSYSFLKIGLKRNPFGACTSEEWARFVVVPKQLEKVLNSGFTCLQLLGPMGSGKTSLLLRLVNQYMETGDRVAFEYLAEGQKTFQTETAGLDVFILDEAQRLSWWHRRKLLTSIEKRTTSRLRLVLSSHQDLTVLFNRHKLPLITINLRECMSAQHYEHVISRRLDYFSISGVEHPRFSPKAIHYLYDLFGENMREAEYFLYEVFQRLKTVEIISFDKLARLNIELEK